MTSKTTMICGLVLLTLVTAACDRERQVSTQPPPAATSEEFLQPYAPGAWRLAPHELPRRYVSLSHVLIAHRESKSGHHSFLRAPNWSAERPSARTRQEAQALAVRVAELARAGAVQFADLVRQYSDDLTNISRAGSLGAWCAADLPPEVLDAISEMRVGGTSRVLETPLGFHVLQLRATPPALTVAARRILITYAGTMSFFRRRHERITRSRAEAESLAVAVAKEAAADPSRFTALIDRYTDHAEALRGGDFGLWSTRERSTRRRESEVIAALDMGGVSEPVDGSDGFSIFQRTAADRRPTLATTYLQVSPSGTAGAKHGAAVFPADVRAFMAGNTKSFEQLRAKYCCASTDQWELGRGDPRVEQRLLTLAVGDTSTEPLDVDVGALRFYKRLEPSAPSTVQQETRGDLPKPQGVDVDAVVATVANGESIAGFVDTLRRNLGDGFGLGLDEPRHTRVAEIMSRFGSRMRQASSDDRASALRTVRQELQSVLSASEFAAFQANVRSALARSMLANSSQGSHAN